MCSRFVLAQFESVAMGHPYVMLSTIVATIAVLPASIAYLGRRSLPPFVTYALTHAAISGFAVALAASPPLAAMTTGMLGKVTKPKLVLDRR